MKIVKVKEYYQKNGRMRFRWVKVQDPNAQEEETESVRRRLELKQKNKKLVKALKEILRNENYSILPNWIIKIIAKGLKT